MLTAGALAMFATAETALMGPPPNRPKRPARKADQGAGYLRAIRWLRDGFADLVDDGPWLPMVSRQYPY
jgi:hypothetical protein